jgi:hypothetical protein
MRSDHRPVHDAAGLIDLELERFEDPLPPSTLGPVREPVVDRLPRPKPLRQVSPRHPGLGAVENRVDEATVVFVASRPTLLRPLLLELLPLPIGQRVSVLHGSC